MSRSAVFLALALATISCRSSAPASAPNALTGKKVSFALPDDEGALVTVPVAGAQATVVDFFGPTCVPCKESLPALLAKKDALASKGATLVLVAVLGDGESTDDARRALESWGVKEQHFLVDKEGTGKRDAGVQDLPATLVLDAQGVLKWSAPAGARAEDVEAAVP